MMNRLLIADTDHEAASALRRAVDGFDVEVKHTENSDDALAAFFEFGPDVMVVDTLLPRKGGLELVKAVRKAMGGDEVTIFLSSAFGQPHELKRGTRLELGNLEVLSKPFSAALVKRELSRVLPEKTKRQSVSFCMDGQTRKGDFTQGELPMLLAGVMNRKETCRIDFGEGKIRKTAYVRDGDLVFCGSNLIGETLGRHLLNSGMITDDIYRRAIGLMLSSRRKMGEVVVELGHLQREKIDSALRRNMADKLLDLFTWPRGTFNIKPWAEPPSQAPGGALDGAGILKEASESKIPVDVVRETLTRFASCTLHNAPDGTAADSMDAYFASNWDGKTVQEVTQELERLDKLPLLYYQLLSGHMTVVSDAQTTGRKLTPQQEEVEKARMALQRMRSRNHFQVLGVGLKAEPGEISSAYRKLAAKYHPDAIPGGKPEEYRQILADTFILISEAHTALSDGPRRRAYIQELEDREVVTRSRDTLSAESVYQEGLMLFRKKDWKSASAKFDEASQLNPDEPEYLNQLGICLMRIQSGSKENLLKRAEEAFHKAHQLAPHIATPLYRLGRISQQRGDQEGAVTYFVRALRRAPTDHEIQRELRLLQKRSPRKLGRMVDSMLKSPRKR